MSDDLQEILASESVPTEDGDPVFEKAWQARIFGLAVAMREDGDGGDDESQGVFEWKSFQERLAEEIATDETDVTPDDVDDQYYHQWLAALERLLVESGHVDEHRLQDRTAEFAAGDRTAAEFVEGEHEADHGHQHDHDHGHQHDH